MERSSLEIFSMLFLPFNKNSLNWSLIIQIMSLTRRQEKLLYAIEKRLQLTSPWVSTNTATGFLAKIFGSILQTPVFPTYPMHPSSPVPYIRDAHEYLSVIPLHPHLHCRFDFTSFQTLLLFCTTTSPEDYAQLRLSSYIPFVRLPVEFKVASYVKYPFTSCALKSFSYYSNSFVEMIGSSTELPNPHYCFELDFESAEEMEWQRSPGYRGVEYLSKEGQRKENRRDHTSMRRFQKRAENRDMRLMGLLPLHHPSGTHNGKHCIWQPLQQPPI